MGGDSGDPQVAPQPPVPSLSEGQRERIKITAAYLNGIAIGLLLVGGLSLPATIALNARGRSDILIAVSLSLFSLAFSPYIHSIAKSVLGRLDR